MSDTPKYMSGKHHPIDPENRKLCFVHCGKPDDECDCYRAFRQDLSMSPDDYDRILPHLEPSSFREDLWDGMVLLVWITCIALVLMLAAAACLALWILH
jgi:hypothetical protein